METQRRRIFGHRLEPAGAIAIFSLQAADRPICWLCIILSEELRDDLIGFVWHGRSRAGPKSDCQQQDYDAMLLMLESHLLRDGASNMPDRTNYFQSPNCRLKWLDVVALVV